MDQRVTPKPTLARRRQGVSGEGESGRTGPPTDLRDSGTNAPSPLDESTGLQRSGAEVRLNSSAVSQYSRTEFDSSVRTIRDPYLKNIVRTSSVIFDMPLRLLDTSEEFPANLLRQFLVVHIFLS